MGIPGYILKGICRRRNSVSRIMIVPAEYSYTDTPEGDPNDHFFDIRIRDAEESIYTEPLVELTGLDLSNTTDFSNQTPLTSHRIRAGLEFSVGDWWIDSEGHLTFTKPDFPAWRAGVGDDTKLTLSLDNPIVLNEVSSFTVGDDVTISGTAVSGIDNVKVYWKQDAGSWQLLDTVTVTSGSWSYGWNPSTAVAGSVSVRVEDGLNVNLYDEQVGITVESSADLGVMQIGWDNVGSMSNHVFPANAVAHNDLIYMGGSTQADVLSGAVGANVKFSNLNTGVNGTTVTRVNFIMCFDKNYALQWSNFYPAVSRVSGRAVVVNDSSLYHIATTPTGSTVRILNLTTGAEVSSIDIDVTDGRAYSIDSHGSDIWAAGFSDFSVQKLWKMPQNLSTVTEYAVSGSGAGILGGINVAGDYAYCADVDSTLRYRINLIGTPSIVATSVQENRYGRMASASLTRYCTMFSDGANGTDVRVSNLDFSTVHIEQQQTSENSDGNCGQTMFDGSDFYILYTDSTGYSLVKIEDSDTYTSLGSASQGVVSIDPATFRGSLDMDDSHILSVSNFVGRVYSDYVQDDPTRLDITIKLWGIIE